MRRALCAVALLLVAGCATPTPPPPADAHLSMTAVGQGSVLSACINVQPPGVPEPIRLVGTLYAPSNATTLYILLPGGATTRYVFNVTQSPQDTAQHHALQPFMADHGIATLAVDRPGMGESKYGGPNLLLPQYDAVVGALVEGARRGDWVRTEGCAVPPRGFDHIVLGGESLGSLLATHWAVTHPGIDGLAVMGTVFNGFSTAAAGHGAYCGATHPTAPRQVYFCDVPAPLAPCEEILGALLANATALAADCDALRGAGDSLPTGEIVRSIADIRAGIPTTMAAIPVHIVFWGEDHLRADPGKQADDEAQQMQAFAQCKCAVTSTHVEGASHDFIVTPAQEAGHAGILGWMLANGWGPAA